jgi:F-box protein 9
MRELLASFASLKIEPAVPDVEGEPPLPCPISNLPDELIVHILRDLAISDVADFVRLSLVCKRLAYLVASEQRIWRRICLGTEFGFPGMHYRWNTGIEWAPLLLSDSASDVEEEESSSDYEPSTTITSPRERQLRRDAALHDTTLSLLTPSAHPTWKHMFRYRPRIRFNGCYISTVNYVRSGQLSTNQATWGGAPIHIVTYYRYLRFFRDGSVISLLTSNEPSEVVHHLTPEMLQLHRDSSTTAQSHLPSAVMALAHRGRWHVSHPVPPGVTSASGNNKRQGGNAGAISGDDDVSIETEGVGNKYIFKMELSLRSAGKSNVSRNNKLVWRSFFSYNKLTDDWGEFRLKNDKPYFFSRVRSYGFGLE